MVSPAVYPECQVSVVDSSGKKWTMTVRAGSKYGAVFAYHNEVSSSFGPHADFPKLTPEMPIEIISPAGTRVFHTNWKKAMDWANRKK